MPNCLELDDLKMLCKFEYSYSYYIQNSNGTVYRIDVGVNPDDSFHITDG